MEILSNNEQQMQYEIAVKRVKKISGFYRHLTIYCVVNLFIVFINIQNLDAGESYFQFKNFTTAFFWGLGLLSHALSVFAPEFFFGRNWEERKIKEFMDKDQKQTQKWS